MKVGAVGDNRLGFIDPNFVDYYVFERRANNLIIIFGGRPDPVLRIWCGRYGTSNVTNRDRQERTISLIIIAIITAAILTARYLTDKGKHTVLYKIMSITYRALQDHVHKHTVLYKIMSNIQT